jgi:hypothetical protein
MASNKSFLYTFDFHPVLSMMNDDPSFYMLYSTSEPIPRYSSSPEEEDQRHETGTGEARSMWGKSSITPEGDDRER